ncbi:MAG: hypothetical protein QF755_06230 [Candidatus Peribacteraceae bacterium]|nr:hypothetical protein [Candidatus Peribacteraceae bacterium]
MTIDAKIAMIPITSRSSINVKALRVFIWKEGKKQPIDSAFPEYIKRDFRTDRNRLTDE